MIQLNPFKETFDKAKNFNKHANFSLITSTVLFVAEFLIKQFFEDTASILVIITTLNCLFIIIYAVLIFLAEFFHYNASLHRRYDFIDNSFGSANAETRSSNYYTNEDIAHGIYKMAVNGFENVLFTYKISKEMLWPLWIKTALLVLIVIAVALSDLNNILVLLIQISLPIILIQQAIKHTLFVSRINRVFEKYRCLFSNMKDAMNLEYLKTETIASVLDYETALTYGAILLDSKIYNKLNPSLSEEWNKIKIEYNIK